MTGNPTQAVNYNHDQNEHSLAGAAAGLKALLGDPLPHSILDVGCGAGTWLKAAIDLGIGDVLGLDGVDLPAGLLHIPAGNRTVCDLRGHWGLDRTYDLVLCLEVAEHLPEADADALVQKLTSSGEQIFFAAAIPWQGGQNHVNCQWPQYWQRLFNTHGYACRDTLRWKIWEDRNVEPWYRQNLFLAHKDASAGQEPRIPAVVHPDLMGMMCRQWRCRNRSLMEAVARGVDRWIRKGLGRNVYE